MSYFFFVDSEEKSCPLSISKWSKKCKDGLRAHKLHILGTFLAFISGLIFTINNCIIQTMSLDFSEVMLVRGTLQVSLMTVMKFYSEAGEIQ